MVNNDNTIYILVNADCGPYNSLLTSASFCVGYKGRTSGCNGDSGIIINYYINNSQLINHF